MMGIREEAREAMQIFQSQSGMTLRELALRTKFSYYSMRHLAAGADYGKDGEGIAIAVLALIRDNPTARPENPGRLYETKGTREMDDLLRYCLAGGWGTLYGPAGTQKTHFLSYRAAEAADQPEPWCVLINVPGLLTPTGTLARIAMALGAPYAQSAEGLRRSITLHVRARRTPVVLIFDCAHLLYKCVDSLEAIRRLADVLPVHGRNGIGLVMAGNEQICGLFKERRGNYFEQWRSRIEQKSVHVMGPSKVEAGEMVRGELGENIKPETVDFNVMDSMVRDPVNKRDYVSTRRLFNTIRDYLKDRGQSTGKGRTQ